RRGPAPAPGGRVDPRPASRARAGAGRGGPGRRGDGGQVARSARARAGDRRAELRAGASRLSRAGMVAAVSVRRGAGDAQSAGPWARDAETLVVARTSRAPAPCAPRLNL